MKVGLLVIATNKYLSFVPPLLYSADSYFLPEQEVTYFIFADDTFAIKGEGRDVVFFKTDHKPWPHMTLGRYRLFHDNHTALSKMDYLYYCDADMRFESPVGNEILGELVVTQHPGTYISGNRRGAVETRPESTAYISPEEKVPHYVAGGFNGGTAKEFLIMSQILANNIDTDTQKGITAIWHDESHLNRYILDSPPSHYLTPSYCFAECYPHLPFTPRLVALTKDHSKFQT